MTSRQVKHTRLDLINELIVQCAKIWLISVTFEIFAISTNRNFFFESCEQRLRLPVDLLRLAVSEVLGCVEMGKQYKYHVKCTSGAARDKRIL